MTKRNADKSRIRREFSKQLRELWLTHPRLRGRMKQSIAWGDETKYGANPDPSRELWSFAERRARQFPRCGRHFCPLVANESGGACALDILFLRRDQPGNLIESGGDIDNRIKVLFDALRMPSGCDEIVGDPEDDDDPFFCLLQDDRLITEVRVSTDRLLTPLADEAHMNDVHLVIHVKTVIVDTVFSSAMWLA